MIHRPQFERFSNPTSEFFVYSRFTGQVDFIVKSRLRHLFRFLNSGAIRAIVLNQIESNSFFARMNAKKRCPVKDDMQGSFLLFDCYVVKGLKLSIKQCARTPRRISSKDAGNVVGVDVHILSDLSTITGCLCFFSAH